MSNTIVAKRYAIALLEIAKEKNTLDQMAEEVRTVHDVFTSNTDIITFLKHPKVSSEQKKQLLLEAFSTVSQDVKNTLLIMVERHRIDEITQMAADFVELVNDEQSVAEAKVYTIRPLTEEERAGVSSVFAAKVGKKSLKIENIVDRDLIGGMKLRIGNRIFDGSISGKLNRLERQLLTQHS
ncbi:MULTISPECIES: F0F1 ATP synthase subunit delta [Bacillus]|uniref:F0F1 ATP synthase subunit delta n=1 Tax=Bacillus TaxID=1386 RepID=UPI0002DDAFC2|nr:MULTISPECIES: F0F1 ATP synthase subunit delta [Bacillus]